MSLKFRLALLNTFFVLAALGIGLGLLVFQSRRVFLESVDRELVNRGNRMMNNPRIRNQGPNGGPQNGGPTGGGPRGGGPQNQDQTGSPNDQSPQNNDPSDDQGPGSNGQGNGLEGLVNPASPQRGRLGLGPEFAGPPNDDIGRPILFNPEGKLIDSRETKILDSATLAKKDEHRPQLATVLVEGIPTRVITVPLRGPRRFLGYAQFGHDLQDFERLKETQIYTILLLIPFALIISAGVGWVLADMAVKPINEVAKASEKISGSDMSTRLTVKGNDEIGRLSLAFNGMVDRLQLSSEEKQKLFVELQNTLEQQRQFVADASHELRTPLARLRITTSSVLEQESSPDEMKEALEIADRETIHMSNLVDQLLTLARLDSRHAPTLVPVNLSSIAEEAAAKFSKTTNLINLNLSQHLTAMGDHDSLVRAVVNLIENAIRYAPEKEILVLTQGNADQAILIVRDHGPGIGHEHISHLTERFYRVDDARNRKMGGTGLGLAIVKSIVEGVGGRLVIESKVGEGTSVQLIFPIQKT